MKNLLDGSEMREINTFGLKDCFYKFPYLRLHLHLFYSTLDVLPTFIMTLKYAYYIYVLSGNLNNTSHFNVPIPPRRILSHPLIKKHVCFQDILF